MNATDRAPAADHQPRQSRRSLLDVIGLPDEDTARRIVAAWAQACAQTAHGKAGESEAA